MAIRTIAALTVVALFTCTDTPTAWGQCQANESAKLLASDGGPYHYFSAGVGMSGNAAVVGAFGDAENGYKSGAAYVFRFDGSTWTEESKLTPSDAAEERLFGLSVALSGNTALIGAAWDEDNGFWSGAAYVFRFDGFEWVEEAKLTASDGAEKDWFYRVAISGDTAIVGALGDDVNGRESGSAYVFRFDGSTWVEETKLTPSDGSTGDWFGDSLAISGDIVVVGAALDGDYGRYSGAAYVYRFDGSTWVEEAKLTASDASAGDVFGHVSIHGDVIVVGAQGDNDHGRDAGAAYVFRFDGFVWEEEAKLTASDGTEGDSFGRSVSIDGDTVVVGAVGSGSVYVFRYDGFAWTEVAKLTTSNGQSSEGFGEIVAISRNTALVAAAFDGAQGSNAGSAYVFRGLSDCNDNDMLDRCEVSGGTAQDCNDNDVPDDCDIAGGTSIDENSNGVPDECETVVATLDIKPGSCPNPVNTRSKGVVPVAIVGSESLDVTEIDVATLTLRRADGVGGTVSPLMGPPGPGIATDDVSTPFAGELCGCHELAGDGIDDLLLKFSTPELAEALDLTSLPPGTSVILTISGSLLDGTLFEASDCIITVGKRPRVRPPGKRVR